jgi:hypothetical protein
VPSFLVETFLARSDTHNRIARERRARSVADELSWKGIRVRYERSIHVPEDELCFFVFEAPSGSDAALAAELAKLDPYRIVEAVTTAAEGGARVTSTHDRMEGE